MQHKLANILLCCSLYLFPLSSGYALNTELPDLGNSARSAISPERERDIGRAFMRKIRQNKRIIEDPLLTDYIQQLGQQLTSHSSATGQDFTFFLLDNPRINAFAGPAGYIGINSGLLLTTQTESELASVMAHEIAHVSQQHLLRAWENAGKMSVPSVAIALASIALGAVAGPNAGIAAAAVGEAAMLQQQINFTRANEKEADFLGIDILSKAGFETRAMPAFFNRMGKANRIYESKLPEFLLTHPVTENRIADALSRSEEYPYVQARDSLRYQLARMRLQQNKQIDAQSAVKDYQRLLTEGRYRNKLATEYAYTLALLRAEQLTHALNESTKLLKEKPQLLEFIILHAEIQAQRGQTDKALSVLKNALLEHPGSYALNIDYANTAIAHGHLSAAINQLSQALTYLPQQPQLYALLAKANGKQKNLLDAYRYQAEYHYLSGDYPATILQLEAALRLPDLSFYNRTKIESRLAAVKDQYRAEQ